MRRIVFALGLGLLCTRDASATPSFTLTASPDPVTVGNDVTVTVHGDVSDLLTLILNPVVDTSHLSLVSFLPGAGLPGASDPLDSLLTDGTTANPSFFFSGSSSVTGSDVTIATMIFSAVAPGIATVDFSGVPLSTVNPSCDPAALASCYQHNAPGADPTPISGSVAFTIDAVSVNPVPAPHSAVLIVGLLGLAGVRLCARGRVRGSVNHP